MSDAAVTAVGGPRPFSLVFRMSLGSSRRSGIAWAAVFALSAMAVVSAYESAYPTELSRRGLALLLEGNRAFEALFGQARALDTPGGFAAWRGGSPISVLAAVAGLLAMTRLLRGEEEAGRWERFVAGAVTPAAATTATLAAYGVVLAAMGLATLGGLVAAGLEVAGSALIAAVVVLTGAAFAAVGAVAAQLVPIRRRAAGLAGTVLAVALLMRVLADGTESLGWLRPLTPFGWAELVRPFAGSSLVWLVPLVLWTAAFVGVAVFLSARRDLGGAWLAPDTGGRSNRRLLGSAEGLAVRSSLSPIAVWTLSVGVFAAVLGALSVDIAAFAARSEGIRELAQRLGAADLTRPTGFLGIAFSFLVLPVSLAAVFRLSAVRDEEVTGRLDLTLGGAVRRRAWLLAWAAMAVGAGGAVALGAGIASWVTTVGRGADVSVGQGVAAGLNALPPAVVFVGLGVLAFAALPRWSVALTLGAIGVAELIQIVGSLGDLPDWIVDLSPYSHVAPVPAADANLGAAIVMLGAGLTATAVGLVAFGRRDVTVG